MNGCELPNGIILHVEPTSATQKVHRDSGRGHTTDNTSVGLPEVESGIDPTEVSKAESNNEVTGNEDTNNDELDDFFSSLE